MDDDTLDAPVVEEPAADDRGDETFQHGAPDAATTQNPPEAAE